MKSSTVTILALVSGTTNAQWWDHNGNIDWGMMGGTMVGHHGGGHGGDDWEHCAVSCFASAFPSDSKSWPQACATPTSLANCISSACTQNAPKYSMMTSIRSSMCSAYSSCASAVLSQNAATTCGAWGFWGPCDGGWQGGHGMGWYTITGNPGQTSGWTTTTQIVTTTLPGGSVATAAQTKTATIVAAAAVTASTSSLSSSSNVGAALGLTTTNVALGIWLLVDIALVVL